MAYAISSDGVAALKRLNPWLLTHVSGEPIVGLMDGSNVIFHIENPPAETGTIVLKDDAGSPVVPSSVNEDTGEIVLSAAPTSTVRADYTQATLESSAYQSVAVDGFSLMERLVSRGWYLYTDTGGTGETYISDQPDSVSDPTVAGQPFSTQIVQTRFYEDCSNYQLFSALHRLAVYTSQMVREERVGGLQIDPSRTPAHYEALMSVAWDKLKEEAEHIADQSGVELDFGAAIAGAMSNWTYDTSWWRGSKQEAGVIP